MARPHPPHRAHSLAPRRALLAVACLALGAGSARCASEPVDVTEEELTRDAEWRVRDTQARRDEVIAEVARANAALDPAARRAKYEAMAASPHAFLRGSAHLYYRDVRRDGRGRDRVRQSRFYSPDAVTWLVGDAHALNFGAFDDDRGRVVYDLNDFDEALVGSYLFDVLRLATSVALVAEENGLSTNEASEAVDALTERYLDRLDAVAGNDDERGAQVTEATAYGRLDEFLAEAAREGSRRAMLDEWTRPTTVGARVERRFDLAGARAADLAAVPSDARRALTDAVGAYAGALHNDRLRGDARYFRVLDVARRLEAGTGSLGTDRYYVLIAGPSDAPDDDRILDVKRQALPAIAPYLPEAERAALTARFPLAQAGCRVAAAHRALLAQADDHAGCLAAMGASFSVRERSPYKRTLDVSELDTATRLRNLAEQWGELLANAHARADDDNADGALVSASLEARVGQLTDGRHDSFRRDARAFALGYAAQARVDHAAFVAALRAGRLE